MAFSNFWAAILDFGLGEAEDIFFFKYFFVYWIVWTNWQLLSAIASWYNKKYFSLQPNYCWYLQMQTILKIPPYDVGISRCKLFWRFHHMMLVSPDANYSEDSTIWCWYLQMQTILKIPPYQINHEELSWASRLTTKYLALFTAHSMAQFTSSTWSYRYLFLEVDQVFFFLFITFGYRQFQSHLRHTWYD